MISHVTGSRFPPPSVYMMDDDESEVESLNFLPENLRDSLLDFQKQGVKFGIRNKGRCLVGDEMGLGKTLQALSIAYYYKDEWPLLIVVPSSMKYPWIEEIEKWIVDLQPGDINLIRSGTDISNISTCKISIMGYGLCIERKSSQLLVKALKEQAFKVVILDESHYLKNRMTGRTKLLHPLVRSAKRTILLTGTPSLARPEELYAQLDIVCPGGFGSFSNFADLYCDAHYEFIGKIRKWNTRGACNLDKLHQRLHNGIMIRRLKKNVLTQLPPKRRQKITFEIPDSDYKKDLLQSKQEFKQYHETLKSKEATPAQKREAVFEINRLVTVLYHYTGLAKAGPVQQYISDLLDGMDNKFIVFCRHKQVVTAVIQQLAKKNVRYICIDGSVPPAVRGSLVNQFQNNPLYHVAVLAIEAASFGLTLTAADHVVFAELHYTPGVMLQAEDRAHRIGQVNAVNIHYLVGRGTMDEILWGMIKRKIYVTSSTLDGKLAELHAEDGDEEISKQLSICAAWLNEETDDEDGNNYLFSQSKKKGSKQIEGQRDLRSFFKPPTKSQCDLTSVESDDELMEVSMSFEKAYSASSCSESPLIAVEDDSNDDVAVDGGGDGVIEEVCNEDVLAGMLAEDEDNSQDTVLTTNQSTPPPHESTETKTQFKKPKKQSPNTSNHLYEFSEYTDSEDIFNSYIKSDNDEEEEMDDGNDEASGSTSTLSLSSIDEGEQNSKTFLNLPKTNNCLSIVDKSVSAHDNSLERRDVLEAKEEKDEVSAKSLQRNPFSLKHKGSNSPLKRQRIAKINFNQGIVDRDSDDEDFQTPMPKPSKAVNDANAIKDVSSILEAQNATATHVNLQEKLNCPSSASGTNVHLQENKNSSQGKENEATDAKKEVVENVESMTLTLEVQNSSETNTVESGKTFVRNERTVELKEDETQFFDGTQGDLAAGEKDGSSKPLEQDGTSVHNDESCRQEVEEGQQEADEIQQSQQDESCSWPCSVCTLLNDPQMIECSLCFTSRPKRQKDMSIGTVAVEEICNEYQANKRRKVVPSCQSTSTSAACCSTENTVMNTKSSSALRQNYSPNDDDDFKEPLCQWSQWSCSACTLLNDAMLIECSVCMTPRRRSQRRTPSHWSTSSCEKRWQKRKRVSESSRKMTCVVKCRDLVSEEISGNSSESDVVLEETPSSTEQQYIKQTSRKRLRLENVDEIVATNSSQATVDEEKDKQINEKEKDMEIKDISSEQIVAERPPSLIDQQQRCLQNRRKRLRLENADETSSEKALETTVETKNDDKNNREKINKSQSEELNVRSECDSDEKTNQITEIEMAANTEFMLNFSDSDGTDDEAPSEKEKQAHINENLQVKLQNNSQEILQERIAFALETIEDSTNTCKNLEDVETKTTRSEVLENNSQKKSQEMLQQSICAHGTAEIAANVDKDNCVELEEEDGNVIVGENKETKVNIEQENKLLEEETERVAKKKKLFVNNLVDERHAIPGSRNEAILHNKQSEEETVSKNGEYCGKCSGLDSVSQEIILHSESKQEVNPKDEETETKAEKNAEHVIRPLVEESENKEETQQAESLEELQEAAEEVFGQDSEMMDDLVAMGSVCSGENGKKEKKKKEPKEPPPPLSLRFSRSLYTDRVFLYDEDGTFLKCNFQMNDIKDNSKEDLPYILQNEHNYKQAKTMTYLWKRLGSQMQRIVVKSRVIFKDPLEAYKLSRNIKKEPTTIRHWTKELCLQQVKNAAERVGGNVRKIVKPHDRKRTKKNTSPIASRKPSKHCTTSSETEEISCMQAFGPDETPLCLFCRAPVDYGSLANDWDCRFCSFDCKENYQIRISGTATRRKLFDAEHGICQLCHFDAHAFYCNVNALRKKDRREFLEKSIYADLPPQLLNRMILDPKEGMFWEADHIVAVAEGGGECGIENLRTLCVPCHKKVTKDLLIRLKTKRKTVDTTGTKNIAAFYVKKT